jgi:NAD(P)-dependent dehydrogenase (short-subunit alcohol dehydrogenase family)
VGAAHELAEEDWDRELDTNLKSVYLVSKVAWPLLRERGSGAIVNTASIAGLWAIPVDAAYCASKAGVIMLTKCMALDGAKSGIRVNCVCPGYTETPMIEGYFAAQPDPAEARRFATGLHPLGRLGRPRDIADAIVYLASDEAAWVTGTAFVVDGGLTSGIWAG